MAADNQLHGFRRGTRLRHVCGQPRLLSAHVEPPLSEGLTRQAIDAVDDPVGHDICRDRGATPARWLEQCRNLRPRYVVTQFDARGGRKSSAGKLPGQAHFDCRRTAKQLHLERFTAIRLRQDGILRLTAPVGCQSADYQGLVNEQCTCSLLPHDIGASDPRQSPRRAGG